MTETTPPAGWLAAMPRGRLLAEVSVWSADLVRIADDVARLDPFTDIYHVDVSDGHFTPAMLFFPDLLARLRAVTRRPLHVHLMAAPSIVADQVEQFADAGADMVTIHAELGAMVPDLLARIHARGLMAGIVLRVETPVATVRPWLGACDMLTLLGTAIGVKGQQLDPAAAARLREARAMLREAGHTGMKLAADGGIREHTVPDLREAGADTVVMGSLAFAAPDLPARMAWLHGL